MAKASYETRGINKGLQLCKVFLGCESLYDFEFCIRRYNATHKRPLKYAHGVSRITIIDTDFVVKFDYRSTSDFWKDGRAGSCESEAQFYYGKASEAGMEYLLAKPTYVSDVKTHRSFSVMPRIDRVNDLHRTWYYYCTPDEEEWLCENINDLHRGNVGYKNDKVCVIDYAWEAENSSKSVTVISIDFSSDSDLSTWDKEETVSTSDMWATE